ncbi:MAG: LysM peptidoglycan-binding domain-containing protein [Thermoanaerobaculia bacterium]
MTSDEKYDDMPDFSGVTGGASTSATTRDGKPVEAHVSETYTVMSGDSLSKIAKKKYGDAQLWRAIYEANIDLIKDPDVIQVGWRLTIPARPSA